jgi:glycine/D-amino acid oxidase-like deaminating enzyme
MGYSTGPLTGRLIAQMVAKEKTEIDVEPYSIKRF